MKPNIDVRHDNMQIPTNGVRLEGTLAQPTAASGLVLFVHGSGSSRFSSRNRFVADSLNDGGLATLLFDLLTAEEHAIDEGTRQYRFNIPLLTQRLTGVVDWMREYLVEHSLPIGLFGASTGAAAALRTAAERPDAVKAVVSRGGRPDLAADALPKVKAPTLLIVGGRDFEVIDLNEQAAAQLRAEHRIEIVPGATHLFEEPGALEHVSHLARNWFLKYLASYQGEDRLV